MQGIHHASGTLPVACKKAQRISAHAALTARVYPCHQFVGIEEWKMGDIFSDKIDQKIKDYFAGIHIYSKENCGNCWARFYCSGGCNANSFIYEGDVKKPHKLSCELQKKRIECAIALAAAGKDAE